MLFKIDTPKIGDALWQEPALNAFAELNGEKVKLYNPFESRRLFEGHPNIELVDDPRGQSFETQHIWRNCMYAECNFAIGYFKALGIDPKGHRQHFYNPNLVTDITSPRRGVMIVPFSDSNRNDNKCPKLQFWQSICHYWLTYSIGGINDPLIDHCVNMRGLYLDNIAYQMQRVRVIVTVDTMVLPLSSIVPDARIVYLCSATPEWLCKPLIGRVEVVKAINGLKFDAVKVYEAIQRQMATYEDHVFEIEELRNYYYAKHM